MVIKKLRLDRAWSQEDLAEISGISARTIQRIEQGGAASLESLKCLAAVFETSIPNIRNAPEMAQPDTENPTASDALSQEDRAALRYVKYLRKYDDWYDEDGGYDDADHFPSDMSANERTARKQVRNLRDFYLHALSYIAVVAIALVVNIMTNPGYLWVLWLALGWGIGLAFHAIDVFSPNLMLGGDWERREVMKRLKRMHND